MAIIQDLNLARKWRPKRFDTIIGQDVSVRMLKNSLYLNKFFPVYLFAGQRGCGKTSSARVFAAAVNCQKLVQFQADPLQDAVPCLECPSCLAMASGSHPDFIEVDAASHTGVDNVRQIIDTSNYMPLLGQRKAYLIDEAHMLSKAAFNAFLKLLEEPPATVIFMLATTEVQKIPQTVLSRCFQVTFTPITHDSLRQHLGMLCAHEHVDIEADALDIIIQETEGSARDAINLLERVRFSGTTITLQMVLDVLGKLAYSQLIDLFEPCIDGDSSAVLEQLRALGFEQRSAQMLWDMLIQLCRCLVWIKYGVTTIPHAFEKYKPALEVLAKKCSINRLNAMLQLLWEQEELFLKTNKKHLFLEMVLLQLCQQVNLVDIQDLIKQAAGGKPGAPIDFGKSARIAAPSSAGREQKFQQVPADNVAQPVEPVGGALPAPESASGDEYLNRWKKFVDNVAAASQDPFLVSILTQACPEKNDLQGGELVLKLASNNAFLRDKINETRSLWQACLHELFPGCTGFSYVQADQPVQSALPPRLAVQPSSPSVSSVDRQERPAAKQSYPPRTAAGNYASAAKSEYVNVNVVDKKQWPLATMVMAQFPGKLKKVNE